MPPMNSKRIEITFRLVGRQYEFVSADGKIRIGHRDRDEATIRLTRLVEALAKKRKTCRIVAHAPLGQSIAWLRELGASYRLRLKPPPKLMRRKMSGRRPAGWRPPVFASWFDYLRRTSKSDRMRRCRAAANTANRKDRVFTNTIPMTAWRVKQIMDEAEGRCVYCGSLAVEKRPHGSWAKIGRRIGSLEHLRSAGEGGGNNFSNLAWACLWCNVWRSERRPYALDHGGYYPDD